MRQLFVLFLAALLGAPGILPAQQRLKQPLTYVAADSVVVWGQGYDDLRGAALRRDATLRQQSFVPSATPYRRQWKEWQQRQPATAAAGADAVTAYQAAAQLFRLCGEGAVMDAAEHLLYNTLYHDVLAEGPMTFDKHTAAQALLGSTGLLYAVGKNGKEKMPELWVNLYLNSTTHIVAEGLSCIVDQMTQMPFAGRVKLRLTSFPHNGYPLTLRLRLPGWAGSLPTVYLNGRPLLRTDVRHGYLTVSRRWNRGDELYFDLPMTPQVLPAAAPPSQARLRRGPLLYTSLPPGAALPAAFEEEVTDAGIPLLHGTSDTTFVALPYFLSAAE